MSKFAVTDWLNEEFGDTGDVAAGQAPTSTSAPLNQPAPAPTDPSVTNPAPKQVDQTPKIPEPANVHDDPAHPDIPEEMEEKDFEQWKDMFFKEAVKGDTSKLLDLIHQVRDLDLDDYPRKFVEDNLQVLFLRQNANIDKASKEIRKLVKDSLDQNNPSVSLVNHINNTLDTMPELNNIFIKLKGLLGAKSDMHRKFIASIIGGVQVGTGGNNEDVVFPEKEYSLRISTRYNNKWGKVDIGKWSLREDDPERYLTEPEQRRLEEGSPEEKEVLRKRIVLESIASTFKKRAFITNVVGNDGTVYMLGWDLSGSLRSAYTDGKLVVKTIQSDNSEAMIDDDGAIIPYVDIKIKYVKESGGVDDDGKPAKEEHDFMERIDGTLFLTAQFQILKEASTSFPGIVLKETPYTGNPSDLRTLMRCIPNASEMLLRQC